jgi:hypothetical protein
LHTSGGGSSFQSLLRVSEALPATFGHESFTGRDLSIQANTGGLPHSVGFTGNSCKSIGPTMGRGLGANGRRASQQMGPPGVPV